MLPPTPVFALTTRGLEEVSAREMAALPGVTITQRSYRRIAATCARSLAPLLGLRTVDDVFVDLAAWSEIGHQRATLARLARRSAGLDWQRAVAACGRLRSLRPPLAFSVTASFVGRRNYSADEIKAAVAEGAMRGQALIYQCDDRLADLNLRVFIEHEVAYVGVRLGRTALHERGYRQVHRPGALKAPVAAALLDLAGVAPGRRLLDPCCGTGTIVIEAALVGAEAQGGDYDPAAVDAARTNAADLTAQFSVMDARRLPLAAASVDCIVSNLPWGRQVGVATDLASLYREGLGEMRRVLAPNGRIVLLTGLPHLVQHPAVRCRDQFEISLFGQTPTVCILTAK